MVHFEKRPHWKTTVFLSRQIVRRMVSEIHELLLVCNLGKKKRNWTVTQKPWSAEWWFWESTSLQGESHTATPKAFRNKKLHGDGNGVSARAHIFDVEGSTHSHLTPLVRRLTLTQAWWVVRGLRESDNVYYSSERAKLKAAGFNMPSTTLLLPHCLLGVWVRPSLS